MQSPPAAFVLSTTVALAALCHEAGAGVVTHTVYLHDYTFSTDPSPEVPTVNTITINAGDTVRWVWVANFHSVVQVEGPGMQTPFQSILTEQAGFVFEHTFTMQGEYVYICEIHGSHPMQGMPMGMWGGVTVIPTPAAAPALAWAGVLACWRWRRGGGGAAAGAVEGRLTRPENQPTPGIFPISSSSQVMFAAK